jgi:membrane protease YdiL (CAAX protease family)
MRRAGGLAALLGGFAARPLLSRAFHNPTGPLVALFLALLAAGLIWPVANAGEQERPRCRTAVVVLVLGIVAFAFGRLMGGGHPPAEMTARVLALSTLAAVAEEALFRRVVFSELVPGGAGLAVLGSAALFAVVHVSVYGFWVLPVDLGAGLVLSWQRWASGSWAVPAATHVIANVLVIV